MGSCLRQARRTSRPNSIGTRSQGKRLGRCLPTISKNGDKAQHLMYESPLPPVFYCCSPSLDTSDLLFDMLSSFSPSMLSIRTKIPSLVSILSYIKQQLFLAFTIHIEVRCLASSCRKAGISPSLLLAARSRSEAQALDNAPRQRQCSSRGGRKAKRSG